MSTTYASGFVDFSAVSMTHKKCKLKQALLYRLGTLNLYLQSEKLAGVKPTATGRWSNGIVFPGVMNHAS